MVLLYVMEMDLYKELLTSVLSRSAAQVKFPDVTINPSEIVEGECYQILQEIKDILENETLEDSECFLQIECIMQVMESRGITIANRHDFV